MSHDGGGAVVVKEEDSFSNRGKREEGGGKRCGILIGVILLLLRPSPLSTLFSFSSLPSPCTWNGFVFPQIPVMVAFPGFTLQARLDAANADAWSTNGGASIILYSRRQIPDGRPCKREIISSSNRAAQFRIKSLGG